MMKLFARTPPVASCAGAAVAALALVLAALPAPAQQDFPMEVRLAVAPSAKGTIKLTTADEKQIEEVLKKRAPILSTGEGKVEVRGPDDIRVRVPASKLAKSQLDMFVRPGRLEFRHLEDVYTASSPRGRYELDVLNVQGESVLRFRERESRRLVQLPEFLRRSPLILSTADLEPGGAKMIRETTYIAVRVEFNKRATKRLASFMGKPGRMLAIVLDGELISVNAVSQRPPKRKKGEAEELGIVDIGGGFGSAEEAQDLAVVFNAGVLPHPLKVLSHAITPE